MWCSNLSVRFRRTNICGARCARSARSSTPYPSSPAARAFKQLAGRGRDLAGARRSARQSRVLRGTAGADDARRGWRRCDERGRRLYRAARGAPRPMQLVTRHAELVKRIAYHLAGRLPPSVEVDDLIQAGMLGLLEAAANYTANRGASFETYAGIRIRGAMIDALRKLDWAPRSVHRKARAVAAAVPRDRARDGPRCAGRRGRSNAWACRSRSTTPSCRMRRAAGLTSLDDVTVATAAPDAADPFRETADDQLPRRAGAGDRRRCRSARNW